jgi:pimeloyl-ACP methyl ester carboxylesterase
MTKRPRRYADDLRAASELAVFATKGITNIVQEMHRTIGSGPRILGRPLAPLMRIYTDIAYAPIRTTTDLVGRVVDQAIALLDPWLGEGVPGPERDAVVSALNGVVGDYLHETKSVLAITMDLRREGQALSLDPAELRRALPRATGKLLVLVHGSAMSDRQWLRGGLDYGAALEKEEGLGLTPVYLHYNSGLHISTNGRQLAELLERLAQAWPVPVEEINLLGFSMGGLVARSACHLAETGELSWRRRLARLVCLGSPHHGAPLERGGSWAHALLQVSSYSAPIARLARIRSAGLTDMRFGSILDEDWTGRDRFRLARDARRAVPLPAGVACYAIAASRSNIESESEDQPLAGDGMVPVDSALGRHRRPELTLTFPAANRWVALRTSHVELLGHPEVYARLRAWFAHIS